MFLDFEHDEANNESLDKPPRPLHRKANCEQYVYCYIIYKQHQLIYLHDFFSWSSTH